MEQCPSDGGDKHPSLDCPLGAHCTCARPIEKMLKNDSSVGDKVVLSPSEMVLLAGGYFVYVLLVFEWVLYRSG